MTLLDNHIQLRGFLRKTYYSFIDLFYEPPHRIERDIYLYELVVALRQKVWWSLETSHYYQ